MLYAATGGSVGGLGLLVAVTIGPIAIAAAMWFLMGSQQHSKRPTPPSHRPTQSRWNDDHTRTISDTAVAPPTAH